MKEVTLDLLIWAIGFSWTQVSEDLALLRHLKGGFYRAHQEG